MLDTVIEVSKGVSGSDIVATVIIPTCLVHLATVMLVIIGQRLLILTRVQVEATPISPA